MPFAGKGSELGIILLSERSQTQDLKFSHLQNLSLTKQRGGEEQGGGLFK